MVRLFVALALPASLRTHLSMLAGGIQGARWVPPANYHLTLRFIGEVEGWRADEVDEALSTIRTRPFDLSLAGVGTFEKAGKIGALWVGADRSEALSHLQAKVETALQRIGLEPERRRFAPHVTLARTDKAPTHKLVEFVQAHSLFRAPPVRVEHFTLFSSRLGKENPVYVPEVEYELA
ncbi:RNA 2',3'-cyclic phosphodiesterase [Roseomonas sp. CCTCC AB2023176]|uniref:RNA 2',3'-cyclic phosphodiesterase n=1 Tax=Roseomonas sp. CCTCC AB2023176 TaxID=3342640 RepID=UPI0035E2AD51